MFFEVAVGEEQERVDVTGVSRRGAEFTSPDEAGVNGSVGGLDCGRPVGLHGRQCRLPKPVGRVVGLVVGMTGAYASDWSLLSMYLLLIAVVTFRARGLFGKKSVLEA